ncbi:mandelate racemase/muconate lactonizing enzyme family protein [Glaciihabitans sp. INWT7]|uniref:mandelate racemase/muconate lactonizing enzyme family protein n=1 Tax=Glaciihabitans sp. INWT7 TaxID=2596912 RepID=UPI001625BCAB|nr:mandelate racemase/muconate lactonizing enzyme family protein [Glaciihabitans sp. INWT7]QNE46198.1 mandelate racemase/muconate lactonizing enzyme family protein [Glaciihabitans sp. INWT7]
MTTVVSQHQTYVAERASVRLVAVETVRIAQQSNVLFVLVHAADGSVGLGETFYGASSVESYIHETASLALPGVGDPSPAAVARRLASYVGYSGSGAEVRGNSAIDIALWDLAARRAGLPLRSMLGGPVVDSIAVYNTCAGNDYVRAESRQSSTNWGVKPGSENERYEDLARFLTDPGGLARDLRDEGYQGMKVWPFDLAAEDSNGDHRADLRFGLSVLDRIRDAVGSDMDLYVELHSLWQPSGAERVLNAIRPYDVTWAEDPVRPDQFGVLARLRSATGVPIAVGENLGAGYNSYKPLLDASAADVAIVDIGWSGGITQAMKTAALAEQYGVPIAPHDCTGPVALAVATHVVTAIPNGFVQEVARAFYHGWYGEVSDGIPEITKGFITPSPAAGHGVTLRPEILAHPGTRRRLTRLDR